MSALRDYRGRSGETTVGLPGPDLRTEERTRIGYMNLKAPATWSKRRGKTGERICYTGMGCMCGWAPRSAVADSALLTSFGAALGCGRVRGGSGA